MEIIASTNPSTRAGIEMLLALAADPRALASADAENLVDLLVALERGARRIEGARYRVLSVLARHPAYLRGPVGDAAVEVACALRISERSAQGQVTDARVLARVFPETLEQLAAGAVQGVQARALVEATGALDDVAARAVQDKVLPLMSRQNPAATRKALARAVLTVDPDGARHRHEHAAQDRRIAHYPQPDGMSTLAATLPAEQVAHAMAVVDAHARADREHNPGDQRSLDQARADSLYQLLTGVGAVQTPPALVQVTVPLDTLLGIGQEPGELEGYGPISAQTVRAMAAGQHAVWRRLLTAPDSGLVVKTDPARYRPTAEVRRHVSARDGHCVFPTCSMPAARTDLDHVVAFNHSRPEHGGQSAPENLQALCRHHHRLKHQGGWNVHSSETGGNAVWTSPSGRRYAKAA
jgi:hypothetical protein